MMVKRTATAASSEVVPVQGKLASRTQNISSHKMPRCRRYMGTDALWKDKTTVSHQGVDCSAGERGHMEKWVCSILCTCAQVADSAMKTLAPTSAIAMTADAPPHGAGIAIVCSFPRGGTEPTQAQKERFTLTPLWRPGGTRPEDAFFPLLHNWSEDLEWRGSSQITS